MPRKDRSFSEKDILRIICNNLTFEEFNEVINKVQAGDFCQAAMLPPDEPSPCDVLAEIMDAFVKASTGILEGIQEAVDVIEEILFLLEALSKIPLVKKVLKKIVKLLKQARSILRQIHFYIKTGNDLIVRYLRIICD